MLDAVVAAYLASRALDALAVADRNLARVLPRNARLEAWARHWGPSHRLVVPLYDAHGVMRSVLARSVDRDDNRKSVAPSGHARAGLVMACPLARQILASAARPAWWPHGEDLRLVVAEGEIDFLLCATRWSDADESAPATLGIMSGSWTAEIASRIPDGTVIVIATDDDAAGDKYSDHIVASLAGRDVEIERWRPAAQTQEST